jgi:formiminoglutamase
MKSTHNNFELRAKPQLFSDHVFMGRKGEQRMGDFLSSNPGAQQFCILGISEAIGPFANYGRTGAEHAFSTFFRHFIAWPYQNQAVDIIGNVRFVGVFPEDAAEASHLVEELDAFVYDILQSSVSGNQIPIVIGGGHNNALPLMRWAKENKKMETVINFDAHTDCRTTNRRHSGNSFSYGLRENTLTNYVAFGIQSYGLTSVMNDILSQYNTKLFTYESYLLGAFDLMNEVKKAVNSSKGNLGLEIDMDCIAYMPSSASSPSGFSLDEIRRVLLSINPREMAYLHLTEAAVFEASNERIVGRALAHLCLDFIRSME